MNKMEIRKVDSLDSKVLGLIRRTFLRFEAPDYTEEGINTFFAFLDNFEQMKQLNMFGAFFMGELVGVIGVKQDFSHICLSLWRKIFSDKELAVNCGNISCHAVTLPQSP